MSNHYKDSGMELQRQETPDDEHTYWPGLIALNASLLLGQMERGVGISEASIDCIDIAIGKLEQAKEVIGARE